MIAQCNHQNAKKSGRNRNGSQRYKCLDCGVRFSDTAPEQPLGTMRVNLDKAALALNLMLEGMSVRATQRMTGLCRDTLCDLILVAGEKCQRFTESHVVGVKVSDVQIDEIWAFVGMKQKKANLRGADPDQGDAWTFVAVERDTKLVLGHLVGGRNGLAATRFLKRVRRAIDDTQRYQVTTDGFNAYEYGVPFALGSNVDFGQLIKKYAASQTETRYSPANIISAEKVPQFGNPDPSRICTSHIESMNQTIRMQLRRFTRLTNAHSKSWDHHVAMQSIWFTFYNFCRKHGTIKMTPAMASGLAVKPLGLEDLLSFSS